jgi:NADH dehydrogenase FAD-containing subunit
MLIQRDAELTPQFAEKMRKKTLEILQNEGINVMLKTIVKEVAPTYVLLEDDTSILTETVIWTAGIKPRMLEFDTEIQKSPSGQIAVNQYLQLPEHSEIFAIGDVAMFKPANSKVPLPSLAQVAEKQAKHAAKNIQLLVKKEKLRPFSYHHLGVLMSLGQWRAIGEILNITFWGRITWWIWRTIYLSKLISFKKKVKVAVGWTINLFSPRDISQF